MKNTCRYSVVHKQQHTYRGLFAGLAVTLITIIVLVQYGGKTVGAETPNNRVIPSSSSNTKWEVSELFATSGVIEESILVTKTWDGGGVTNNWSEPANWSGDTIPV